MCAHAGVRARTGKRGFIRLRGQEAPGGIDSTVCFLYPIYNKSELIFLTARYKRKYKPGVFSTFSPDGEKKS